jgi:hypothetical protein
MQDGSSKKLKVVDVPDLTLRGVTKLLKKVDADFLDCPSVLLRTPDFWTPYHAVPMYDDETGVVSDSNDSPVNVWKKIPDVEKPLYLKAPHIWSPSFDMDAGLGTAGGMQQRANRLLLILSFMCFIQLVETVFCLKVTSPVVWPTMGW